MGKKIKKGDWVVRTGVTSDNVRHGHLYQAAEVERRKDGLRLVGIPNIIFSLRHFKRMKNQFQTGDFVRIKKKWRCETVTAKIRKITGIADNGGILFNNETIGGSHPMFFEKVMPKIVIDTPGSSLDQRVTELERRLACLIEVDRSMR